MRLSDVDLSRLLPAFMSADDTSQAMTAALNPELSELARKLRNALIIPRLDEFSEEILDELAAELNIAWYVRGADIDAKRSVIRNAYEIHGRIGTPWAIETVGQQYFGDAEVEEWWEYGGEPYHFRVRTGNVVEGTRDAQVFLRLVEKLKNARSVMDGLYIENAMPPAQAYVAGRVQVFKVIKLGMEE